MEVRRAQGRVACGLSLLILGAVPLSAQPGTGVIRVAPTGSNAGSCGSAALPLARRVIGIDSAKIATPSAPSSHPCVDGDIVRAVGRVEAVDIGPF